MIEICPTSDIPEDAASTTSTVALLAELPSNLLSSTLNVSTTSIFQSPLCEQPPGLSVSTEVSSQLYPNHVVDSFSLFKELLCSTFLNRQTDLLVDNIKLSFSSEKTLTDSSIVSRSQTVAASSSKPLIAQTPVDKSIVTSETADVRRPSDASCGICKTQHRPSKLDSPRTVPADHNDSTTPVRKRLEIANIAVCSTYTLWKFHRLKVQECRRQKRATKTVPTGRPVDENGQDLQVPPEVDGCLPPATSLGHAENVIRDIALRCERSSNSVTTPPSLCEAIFTTQATMNQTFEQSEPDTTLSRLKPNVAEQNREQYEGDRLLSLCFLSCQRGGGDRSGKLFKKRRKCLTLRLCHTTSSALFHFSTNTENYQQFSEILLSDSSNRSLIARPARSNSILRVIYFKLICCPPSCDSPTSSRSIPVLLSCDKYAVLSLEKPVFTKTYNCSYFRHCYRQKYTRRRRPRVTTRKRTSFNKDILTRVNDQNNSTTDEATSCLCTPNQTSNTLPVTSSHGTECPCDAGDRKSKALNNETCQTFNPRVFRTQDSSLWSILSWLTTIFVVILIPIMIIYVLDLFYRIIVIPTKILLQLTYRKLVRKPKGVARSRLKRNDFLRSLLYMLVVFVCCVPHDSSTAEASSFPLDPRRLVRSAPAFEDNFNSTDYSRGRICQSIDVRNSVHNLRLLRGCRVIEGFLQIFVETGTSADWDDYSFPELVEVTDYVVLYRNTGPRSLGSLFPNLALIRGHNLLYNYALVVHECTGMQELALYHLTDILRGSVHIMKNPTLCFVDTVNWDLISWTQGSHYIKENRHPNECPICPLNATGGELCMPSIVTPASRPLCVNTTHCQKMCKVECPGRSCYNDGYSCCNAACIGGCSGNSSSDCVGCRKLEFQGTCVDACDATSYSFIDRRCVSNDECQAQPPPITSPDIPVKYWKFVRNEFTGDNVCVLDCPKGYVEKEIPNGPRRTKFECQRCYSGDCEKKCQGSNIESIQKLQQYKECTYIKGSLEIQIQNGANVVKELENNLGMVEVIEGYLKIARSYPIMSLNFFKKLRLIKGETLETNRFALVVLDNQNLMELWDWSKRNVSLRIDKGQVFFHFNPKLCYYHIENLASQAGLNFTETEVPKSSNGDKAACMISKINSTIHVLSHNLAQISWEKFDHYDSRALLSYLIFYKETKYQNVTMYDSRDACGGDGWKMEDYENIENKTSSTLTNERPEDKWITHILTSLKPFTQYAYYVRTYTIATERNGAQSPIQYFMTLPNTPTFPVDLIATSTSHSEIQISWKPPKIPNGNVTHYFIVGYWERDDPKIIQTRNYCLQHIILSGGGTLISRPSTPAPTPSSTTEAGTGSGATLSAKSATAGEECVCGKKDEKSDEDKMKEINRFIEIEFENALQNQVYVKRILYSSEANRRRRDLEGGAENVFPNVKQTNQLIRLSSEEENQTFVTVPSPAGNVTSPDGVFERFEFVVYGATSFLIRNLSHYAKYNIEVQACREVVPDETFDINNSNCSRKSLVTRRTLAKDGVDSINQTSFRLERSNGSWFALWEAPSNPNGLVVAYKIETARQDKSKYSTPDPHCISKAQYDLDGRYDIASSELVAGNYSIRVRAVSLYGEGAWSEKLYFVVQKPSMSDLELTIMIILLVVIILLITLGLVYYRREKVGALLNPSVNPEYIPVYKKDSWEVARSKVTILDELGNGSFGLVCRGVVKDFRNLAELPCAVKLVNENASDRERAEFLNEASVMKAFDAHHVVKLFGVVSEGHPTLVIMELMAGGDLKNYLRSCRPDAEVDLGRSPPTLKRILQMAAEIADGMAYLADKKYVHRDLAARNCMVAEDMTVKVGDFGMTRDIYETEYYRKGSRGFLPVRWMAPESLKDGVFTSCSDVWSYGVVLWEIATLASQPYQGLTNEQVLNWVKGGGILVRPDNCPDRLFALMRRCWQFKPSGRPTFSLLLADLEHELDPSFRQVSYYHSEAAREHQLRLASKAETRTSSTTLDEHIPLRTAEDIEDFSLSSDSSGEEDNIHAVLSQPFSSKQWNWKGYAAEDNPNSSPGLEMEPCGTPRESNAHAKSSAEFRHRNFNPKRDSSPVQLSGAGRSGWVEEDARYPESKNSTMGRCSEDSRAYLDSSRPSTLGRNDDKFDAKSAYLDSLGRGENATNEEEDEKEKLVAEDSTRRVSICRQNVGTLGGSPGTPAGKSPGKNYSAMAPGNRDVTVGNTSNGRYVDGNDARSAASRATATSAGNLATTNSGNGATVPRASVPSYFGGRFSTLAGVGFRSGAHNLNPVGDTNSTGASVVGANAGETNSEESGGTNTGARNTRINSGANNNTGINAGVNSFGTNCSGSTNLGINGSGVTNTGVTSLGGAANGHIAGGGTLNNGGNNHRRRNNGGPATATSQTSMPC